MRTTWNGSISFGLVTIPVGLAPATKPAARQSDVAFRMLHGECMTPIKQKRWCPTHDREVSNDEIVKGWEFTKGQFVVVDDAELEALAAHDTSRSIEIRSFVPLDEVDPIFFDRTYYLVPRPEPAARRPYALLAAALEDTGMAGIGRFVQGGQEKLSLIRAKSGALALETLFLAEDVYSQAEIDEAVEDTEVRDQELELAKQVVGSLAADFDPGDFTSEYRSQLRALLEAKIEGREIETPEPEETVAPVVDLMEALRRSVEEAQDKKKAAAPKRKAAASAPRARARAGAKKS
jgi:DNA end-binding protein Ku